MSDFDEDVRKSLELTPELYEVYKLVMQSPMTQELNDVLVESGKRYGSSRDIMVWEIARYIERKYGNVNNPVLPETDPDH